MKQILQSLRTGATQVAEVPCPSAKRGQLLIRTTATLVSVGTERMLVEFGKAGWIEKARQQPDKVRMVLDKIKTDGLAPTLEAVFNKLDQPLPLGYCNVGVVEEVGAGVSSFAVGDRVVSNGKHAEMVCVPVNLCCKIPDGVGDEAAAFTVIGAIGLQGVRLAQPTLGETVVVAGLGLIGLVTVQLLVAQGCRVLGLDFDAQKLELARAFGAETVNLGAGEDPVPAAERFSRGRGVDAVLITAATKSNEPVHQAALMCRKRGRIVLVGVAGLELSRADFFQKELSFQVSCSYGPGRYDPNYEEKGFDYPVGYVRWTEQRNFEAVLDMLAQGRVETGTLISHRFPLEDATRAYEVVAGSEPSLGIMLQYGTKREGGVTSPQAMNALRNRTVALDSAPSSQGSGVAFIGAGNYATAVLIPAFKAAGAHMKVVASSGGVSGVHAGTKFGFESTTTDTAAVLKDPAVQSVVITTQHDSHASFVLQALAAGKHVFVEKPLAMTDEEVDAIAAAASAPGAPRLMVGFNRRFAPHIQRAHALLAGAGGPKAFIMTVNAGAIPAEHWTQDAAAGGGRIVGEACHFIDLLRFLAGSPIVGWQRTDMKASTADTVSVQLKFADGSIGTVHYFANGTKRFPKERLEIFASGRVLQMDNFRRMTGFAWPGFSKLNLWKQDKGQRACAAAFMHAVARGGASPIPLDELLEVARATIAIAKG